MFNDIIMSNLKNLEKLPPITDGLTRRLETRKRNGIQFIVTDCRKGGWVFGNHTIEYNYEPDQYTNRFTRVAKGEGTVLLGTVTRKDGKLRDPVTLDALINFGLNEPIFPIGHYVNKVKDHGWSLE